MIPRVEPKSSELVSIFYKQTGWNLARTKFFVLMISALRKVQTVVFGESASAFDSSADTSSSLRRIQLFMATYLLDTGFRCQAHIQHVAAQAAIQVGKLKPVGCFRICH